MKHSHGEIVRFLIYAFCIVFIASSSGCLEDDEDGERRQEGEGADGDRVPVDPWLIDGSADPCEDSISSIYEDPGELPGEKGAIIRCAEDQTFSSDALYNYMSENGYKASPFTSGTTTYRILYRTERGNGEAGYASAKLFLPTRPRAKTLPVVISLRGTVGLAPKCAASKHDHEERYGDFERQNFSLAGYGYAVLATDLAGFANYGASGNPPFGFAHTSDMGKPALDGVIAMRNLLGDRLGRKVVLLGQSQGGHSALSALAMSNPIDENVTPENEALGLEHYGVDGEIAGVALYAPLWFTQRSWGGLLLLAGTYPFETSSLLNMASIWYHYSHGEMLDGEGHGLDIFKDNVKEGVKELVDTTCSAARTPALEELGKDMRDIVEPSFYSAIAAPAAITGDCRGNELCEKWMARYYADRPHIAGSASHVPMLIVYSMSDTTIGPGRMACVFDRLKEDGVPLEVCIDDNDAGHGGTMDVRGDFVADWIASKTLDADVPSKCEMGFQNFVGDRGETVICATPPPND